MHVMHVTAELNALKDMLNATANMEAMAEKMATKIEVQEERMATTEWVNEQVGQLQRDATTRMDSTVMHVTAELNALKD
eukprot:3179862-Amphidinium_carterae.1